MFQISNIFFLSTYQLSCSPKYVWYSERNVDCDGGLFLVEKEQTMQ